MEMHDPFDNLMGWMIIESEVMSKHLSLKEETPHPETVTSDSPGNHAECNVGSNRGVMSHRLVSCRLRVMKGLSLCCMCCICSGGNGDVHACDGYHCFCCCGDGCGTL